MGLLVTGGMAIAIMLAQSGTLRLPMMIVVLPKHDSSAENETAARAMTADARKFAASDLRKYGVIAISDTAFALQEGDKVSFYGNGLDKGGAVHEFMLVYQTVTLGKVRQWHLQTVMLDKSLVFDREH